MNKGRIDADAAPEHTAISHSLQFLGPVNGVVSVPAFEIDSIELLVKAASGRSRYAAVICVAPINTGRIDCRPEPLAQFVENSGSVDNAIPAAAFGKVV
jgi:hypothetical protein